MEDDVTIYPNSTVLGGETVIGARSTIGGNVFLMQSVPPDSLVYYEEKQLQIVPKRGQPARRCGFQPRSRMSGLADDLSGLQRHHAVLRAGAEAMLPCLERHFGNPSSVHSAGRDARAGIDDARDRARRFAGRKPHELIFTSGGTESNNLAVLGLARAHQDLPAAI